MIKQNFILALFLLALLNLGCEKQQAADQIKMEVQADTAAATISAIGMSRDSLYNKVLGTLVGSAIGDAMGAPTEMWDRYSREVEYGYVDSLDFLTRGPSPEGVWDYSLPAGSTTDDTRWKLLAGDFMTRQMASFYRKEGPDPFEFSGYVVDQYQVELKRLQDSEGFEPEGYENQFLRIAWLQEWALVARAFQTKDIEQYTYALHRFYGGDLLCAGMLYAPALGIPYPGHPEQAYQAAYRLGIFDQGYARDITGITAAMVAAAMPYTADQNSVMAVFRTVDPNHYLPRRLFGRAVYATYMEALYITKQAKEIKTFAKADYTSALAARDSLYAVQMRKAFQLIDEKTQDSPAHAREILLVALSGMLFSDFDFQKCMEFIVNYGRDNDTSAAVAGAVLGAYYGYDRLPAHLKERVLQVNRTKLGIDLEVLADQLTTAMMNQF